MPTFDERTQKRTGVVRRDERRLGAKFGRLNVVRISTAHDVLTY
jgi:hypothetical protein